MVSIPRVVIAAPASGHGKTTVATGVMAAEIANDDLAEAPGLDRRLNPRRLERRHR